MKSTKRHIRVVAAQIERDGRYFITQRPPSSSLPLLWEFPGGRVEDGESDEEALRRELFEEMGVEIDIEGSSVAVTHTYPAYDIDFRVYRCRIRTPDEKISKTGIHDFRWVKPEELDEYEFPGADQVTVDRLLEEFEQRKR
ncbi:MAG: (deoxy)nucleoside triphosphate pyrophosphohydrolase [Deltaproteobacteria bacterium]|nr:(deoxy)nucleoside triphosphate pyrophosphohydrolase [Deltaproteobacteria bacterium]